MGGSLKALGVAFLLAAALAGCGGAAPAAPVVVWAVGDGAAPGDAPRRVAALMARDRPAHVLYLGDVYENGTAEEFRTGFAGVYGRLLGRMWPTPGNHEWGTRAQGYEPFWRERLGHPIPEYYAREAGGWQFLSLNSEDPQSPAQLAWARSHVTAGGGTCRIAFWHRPALNAGKHYAEQADVAPLWNAVRGRAAIVLSGHDHDMQRFKPAGGTVQYISGAGGKSHYDVDESDRRLAWSDERASGALRISLVPGRADLEFVAADGTVLDRSTVRCREG